MRPKMALFRKKTFYKQKEKKNPPILRLSPRRRGSGTCFGCNGIRRVEISPLGPSGLRWAQNDGGGGAKKGRPKGIRDDHELMDPKNCSYNTFALTS